MAVAKKEVPAEVTEPTADKIEYCPEQGDPVHTKIGETDGRGGVSFAAGKPVMVPRTTTVLQTVIRKTKLEDGRIVTQGIEERVPLVEVLRHNPAFSINDAPPPRRKAATLTIPTDPDKYRGYATRWIAGETDAEALKARWEAEQSLRDKLGVTERDLALIDPFREARYEMLQAGAVYTETV